TICTTKRRRSAGAALMLRMEAKKRDVASPSTCRTSSSVAPMRPNGLTRGERGRASTAMGHPARVARRRAEVEVQGTEQPAVLPCGEAPEEVPVLLPVAPGVPPEETVQGCPQGQDTDILGEEAVEDRGALAEAARVVLLAAQPPEQGEEMLAVPRRLV